MLCGIDVNKKQNDTLAPTHGFTGYRDVLGLLARALFGVYACISLTTTRSMQRQNLFFFQAHWCGCLFLHCNNSIV